MEVRITRILAIILTLTLFIATGVVSAFALDDTALTATDGEDSGEQVYLEIANSQTVYKYLDDNTDPAATSSRSTIWTLPDFDDSSWKSGVGSFGSNNGALTEIYGKKPNVLLELYQDDGVSTIPTYFFRSTFEVDDISLYNTLTIDANADDSLTIYVNGVVVCDSRSKKQTDTNMYYSSGSWDQHHEIRIADIKGAFKDGENTLAVEVHNNQVASSDIYFSINSMTLSYVERDPVVEESVVLGIGSSESERRLSWFSNLKEVGEVRLVEASQVESGVFPSEYISFEASSTPAINKGEYYAKKATLTGLSDSTDYAYVIVSGNHVGDIHYFSTDAKGDYEFVFVGDPQLDTADEGAEWADTLRKIQSSFGSKIVISAGDHINIASSEKEYSHFLVAEMAGIAFAPTVGPSHDSPSGDDPIPASFSDHFNIPNASTRYGVNATSADYWYTYNNTLFMHLNMSDSSALGAEHKEFMLEAMAENSDVKWNIVVMHTALFSTGYHSWPDYKYYNGEIKKYREIMAPIFTELGIDVVLSGHDHIYVRSQMMNGYEISSDEIDNDTVTNPTGTLHICASSSTGSKFYESYLEADYVAYENSEARKSAIRFSVTDESITLESYFLDDMSVFDTFTIYKYPHYCELEKVDKIESTCSVPGKEAYYICACGLCYEDEMGEVLITDISIFGIIPTLDHVFEKYTEIKATCTENKSDFAYCESGCGQIHVREYENTALGHLFITYTPDSNATCTKNETETATCERGCGETDVRERENTAIGHKFSSYVSNFNATCTEDGTKTAICTRNCGKADIIIDEGTALGHSFGEWTSVGDGTHIRVCERDGAHTEIKNCLGGVSTATKLGTCIVCGGEYGEYKAPSTDTETNQKPEQGTDTESSVECDHMCHSESGFVKFIWNIIRFFIKLFGTSEFCNCWQRHY